jgi:hypothetical protein
MESARSSPSSLHLVFSGRDPAFELRKPAPVQVLILINASAERAPARRKRSDRRERRVIESHRHATLAVCSSIGFFPKPVQNFGADALERFPFPLNWKALYVFVLSHFRDANRRPVR